jgi:hypothetical protein
MTPEAKFSKWVVSNFLRDADVQRIETSTGSGVPDINVCYQGFEFWIETKIMTPSFKTLLRPYQGAWIQRRSAAGGSVFVFSLNEASDHLWIWKGSGLITKLDGKYMSIVSTQLLCDKRRNLNLDLLIKANKSHI